ncbi:hypothetical protein [Shimia sp. Alg240-R146]|uniref:hypothetical protein n=1 Tax=Shimia sp. Alg240-R146 TaxID=2993449 RepID=UPI0022E94453|nr:hypothetical protein [Shimia sp. Alg240-R146]
MAGGDEGWRARLRGAGVAVSGLAGVLCAFAAFVFLASIVGMEAFGSGFGTSVTTPLATFRRGFAVAADFKVATGFSLVTGFATLAVFSGAAGLAVRAAALKTGFCGASATAVGFATGLGAGLAATMVFFTAGGRLAAALRTGAGFAAGLGVTRGAANGEIIARVTAWDARIWRSIMRDIKM